MISSSPLRPNSHHESLDICSECSRRRRTISFLYCLRGFGERQCENRRTCLRTIRDYGMSRKILVVGNFGRVYLVKDIVYVVRLDNATSTPDLNH
jgi:hypothetical protein